MHGRPRQSASGPRSEDRKEAAKVARLESLLAEVLRNHHDRCYTKDALGRNAELLEINPEVYTAWNFRKLAVKHLMELELDNQSRASILQEELNVVGRALKRNYKSYGAWYHRKWVIKFGYSSLENELYLLDKLLAADDRNFHGWDYRRFVVDIKKVSQEDELEHTTKKINENFSNYSAWHNRSALLSHLFKGKFSERVIQHDMLTADYELVKQAFYTEPDDQSAWLYYHSWLLYRTVKEEPDQSASEESNWKLTTLENQISMCRELVDIESNSKWAKLSLAKLLMAYTSVRSDCTDVEHMDEVLQLFQELMALDTPHANYYKEEHSKLLVRQVINNHPTLQKEIESGFAHGFGSDGWFRLRELSLSKVAYLDKLAWLQRLDLSHNLLRSLEGLEALHMLSALDVSCNRISSLTALAPLQHLPRLETLNVSCNEIGGHSIDTTRYTFPSKLSNVKSDCTEVGGVKFAGPWEIASFFQGMKLKELDVAGNPFAEDIGNREKIVESLPSLVLLDGVKVERLCD